MADRASQLVLAALTRAAADPNGSPLLATRAEAGLFPLTAAGKLAARKARDDGLLADDGTITNRGLEHLISHGNPRQVLEDFVRVLEARHEQARELLSTAKKMLASIEGLCTTLLPFLERTTGERKDEFRRFHEPSTVLLAILGHRPSTSDCPLPELFREASARLSGLTIGVFHDALRRLHQQARIYLHPWTGPLYQLPEPAIALLVGHEVAYYASVCPVPPKE